MEEILKECHWDGQYGKSLDELITYANDGPDRTIQAGSAVHASLKNMIPLFKKLFELANKESEASNG